jgi:hypothetical protein
VLSDSLVLAVLIASAPLEPVSASIPVHCPPTLNRHRLDSVEIFHGPPSELMSLHPIPGGWDLSRRQPSAEGMYLVCSYRGTSATEEFRLPDGVRACWFGNNWSHVVCR